MEAAELLKAECVRRLRESEHRIAHCLSLLTEDQVWQQPNTRTVSVGNLVLHLCGNVGQWIGSALGGAPDLRARDLEFDTGVRLPKAALLEQLRDTVADAVRIIVALNEGDLERLHRVQGFSETGVAILVHVAEHFSYHTGQITLHTKLLLDVDTGYYKGLDLNAKG